MRRRGYKVLNKACIPPSKKEGKCPACGDTVRRDRVKEHFTRFVIKLKDGSIASKDSPEFKQTINIQKRRHTSYFLENNFSMSNLPQIVDPELTNNNTIRSGDSQNQNNMAVDPNRVDCQDG